MKVELTAAFRPPGTAGIKLSSACGGKNKLLQLSREAINFYFKNNFEKEIFKLFGIFFKENFSLFLATNSRKMLNFGNAARVVESRRMAASRLAPRWRESGIVDQVSFIPDENGRKCAAGVGDSRRTSCCCGCLRTNDSADRVGPKRCFVEN